MLGIVLWIWLRACQQARTCKTQAYRHLAIESLELRTVLSGVYSEQFLIDPETHNLEERLFLDGFQFGVLLQTPSGTVGFRGHPDPFSPNGFGTTQQLNVFIAGLGVDATNGQIDGVTVLSDRIHLSASGQVNSTAGQAGTWSWNADVSFDREQAQVTLFGTTAVTLFAALDGDMNIGRASSNFVFGYMLDSGDVVNTGDMESLTINYGSDSSVSQNDWVPAPGMEGFFPQNSSSNVTVTVHGKVNQSDPNLDTVRKPTFQNLLESTDPTTKMIAGGFWDSSANDFLSDNIGVSQIVRPQDTNATDFTFQMTTVWTPPDTATLSIEDVEVTETDSGSFLVQVPVRLTGDSPIPFTTTFQIAEDASGQASAGVDFTAPAMTGTLSFAGNDDEVQFVSLEVNGDHVDESDEWFRVSIGDTSTEWVRIVDADARVTIIDDDGLFTNSAGRHDVDNDQSVGISDILVLVADLRANNSRQLPGPPGPVTPPPYLDVDGNNRVDFDDVRKLIHVIRAGGGPEGEPSDMPFATNALAPVLSLQPMPVESSHWTSSETAVEALLPASADAALASEESWLRESSFTQLAMQLLSKAPTSGRVATRSLDPITRPQGG